MQRFIFNNSYKKMFKLLVFVKKKAVVMSPTTCFKGNKMPLVRRHQRYHSLSNFNRCRIVVFRDVGVSYREIARRVNSTAKAVMCVLFVRTVEGRRNKTD